MAKDEGVTVEATITGGKPGVKTSEFWKSLAVHLVGTIITAYGMWKGSEGAIAVGGIVLGLANHGYSTSRGMAKKALSLP